MTMRLIVTRPEPDGSRTAAALRARGHHVTLVPLLRIEVSSDAELGTGPWGAVLITSANAARAIAAHPRRAELMALSVFAVGRRSAEAARVAGFAEVTSADGDAADLANLVAARAAPDRPLLYLAGQDRAADLAGLLAARGLPVRTVEVYRAVAETRLPPAIRAALGAGEVDGVLHYSVRSAEAFVAAVRGDGIALKLLKINHYCISAPVAEALGAAGLGPLAVAAHPDEPALFALLDSA
jgi:uroporphyrinogen-III synthase